MNFSREMMINDDLNVLTSVPRLMRASMERYKNYLAYQALVKAETTAMTRAIWECCRH